MASLTNTKISDTYPLLLKIETNGIDGTLRSIEDGDGTASALQISTGAINVNGTITATTGASLNLDNASQVNIRGITNDTFAILAKEKSSDAFKAQIAYSISNADWEFYTGGVASGNKRLDLSSSGAVFSVPLDVDGTLTVDGARSGDFLTKLTSTNQYGLYIKTTGTTSSHDLLRLDDNSGTVFKVMATGATTVSGDATFEGQANFGTTASYIKQSNFGYSSSYKVLQLGLATSTSAISIGADVSGNSSGGFTGNEIVIPNARGILAPNGANNAYLGVLGVTSNNTIEIGRGNHSIVTQGNGAISIATSNDNVTFSGDVGIGTASPDRAVTIYRSGGIGARLDFQTNDTGTGDGNGTEIGVYQNNMNAFIWNYENSDIYFGANNSERMRITASGFVGINRTSNIHERVTVDGQICSVGSSFTTSTSGNQRAILDLTSNGARIGHFRGSNGAGSGSCSFFVDSTEYWKITSGGNFEPLSDNAVNLGSSSKQVSAIFTANAVVVSDETKKENIKDCDLGIDFVNTLKPKSYNLKNLEETHNDYNKKHYGLIAQDLKDGKLKDSVFGDKDGEYGLNYNDLIAPLIKAVQELSAKVEALENE
jgi:hypothetical protein